MEFEYDELFDLVDTIDRLKELSKDINISSILEGDTKQIELISEIKKRIDSIEVERVESVDFDVQRFQA
jgi:hypothetical protein|tara:strand:+ start:479 stop:685 length:207 start_codon:yes stop_codon:yes gene_type:complete